MVLVKSARSLGLLLEYFIRDRQKMLEYYKRGGPHTRIGLTLVFDFIQSHVRWRGLETSAPMRGWDCAIRFEIQISLPRSSRIEQAGPISLSCRIPGTPYLDNRLRPPRWRRKREMYPSRANCTISIFFFSFSFFSCFFHFLRIPAFSPLIELIYTLNRPIFFSLPFPYFFRFDTDSPDTSLMAQPRPRFTRFTPNRFASICQDIRENPWTDRNIDELWVSGESHRTYSGVCLTRCPITIIDTFSHRSITPLIWRGTIRVIRIVDIIPILFLKTKWKKTNKLIVTYDTYWNKFSRVYRIVYQVIRQLE